MSELLDRLREIGLPMTSTYAPFDFGWTTDEAKATAAEEAGATIREYRSKDPQFSGWEVSVRERV